MRWFLFLVLTGFSWSARRMGDAAVSDPVGSALLSLGILIIGFVYLWKRGALEWE